MQSKYREKDISDERIFNTVLNIENYVKQNKNSTVSILLAQMDLVDLPLNHDITRAAVAYLVYKILSIASKYPSYIDFEKWNFSTFDKTGLSHDDIESLGVLSANQKFRLPFLYLL